VVTGLLLVVVAGLGLVGWRWYRALRCTRIVVTGTQYAETEALIALTRVDTGTVLFDVAPALVADRVRRHPWVAQAEVSRQPWPVGTLRIHVTERTPAALVLDVAGRPAHYLDQAGYLMPLKPEAVYDVPLVHGLTGRYSLARPVPSPALVDCLLALGQAPAAVNALVASLEVRQGGEVWVHTAPAGARGAIPVRLGHDGFAEKLARLHAFWHQTVLQRPDKTFTLIDLRFDRQIVARETGTEASASVAAGAL
jgi:cell division protein FtsQ